MYESSLDAASLSMSFLMQSSHLLTSLEALSVGALFCKGLLVPGWNASVGGGGREMRGFLEEGERGMSSGLLVLVGEGGAEVEEEWRWALYWAI